MTTPAHTKILECACGCGRTMRHALDVVLHTDAICIMRDFKPARLETPDLFDAQPVEAAA